MGLVEQQFGYFVSRADSAHIGEEAKDILLYCCIDILLYCCNDGLDRVDKEFLLTIEHSDAEDQ